MQTKEYFVETLNFFNDIYVFAINLGTFISPSLCLTATWRSVGFIFDNVFVFIFLAPQNHSTTDKIPLTKVGRSLYRVRHNDSGVVRSIVCQIDTVDGSKIVTVHSPIQVRYFLLKFTDQ